MKLHVFCIVLWNVQHHVASCPDSQAAIRLCALVLTFGIGPHWPLRTESLVATCGYTFLILHWFLI